MTQAPVDWQGSGPGSIGPGPLALIEVRVEIACCVAEEERDADARPARATSRAKTRITDFIFSNLFWVSICKDNPLLTARDNSPFVEPSLSFSSV
jgi:hypothetical protein